MKPKTKAIEQKSGRRILEGKDAYVNTMADFHITRDIIRTLGLGGKGVAEVNEHEPWGATYRFCDQETEQFVREYYPELSAESWVGHMLLRPSVIVVLPNMEVPMHYHQQRVELIKVVSGSMVASTVSRCDYPDMRAFGEGGLAIFEPGVQHSIRADSEPLVLAEVWGRQLPGTEVDPYDTVMAA